VLGSPGLDRRVAFHLQHVTNELHVLFVVFDDQDQAHWTTSGADQLRGSVNVNVEPLPGSLSTPIVPPCSSTKRRVSARPSPVPSCLLVYLLPTWRNPSNTVS